AEPVPQAAVRALPVDAQPADGDRLGHRVRAWLPGPDRVRPGGGRRRGPGGLALGARLDHASARPAAGARVGAAGGARSVDLGRRDRRRRGTAVRRRPGGVRAHHAPARPGGNLGLLGIRRLPGGRLRLNPRWRGASQPAGGCRERADRLDADPLDRLVRSPPGADPASGMTNESLVYARRARYSTMRQRSWTTRMPARARA